jgi:hypothetical protein
LEKTVAVQITLKSTQHTGMATSTEGSVAAWQVTFELDEDESLHAATRAQPSEELEQESKCNVQYVESKMARLAARARTDVTDEHR